MAKSDNPLKPEIDSDEVFASTSKSPRSTHPNVHAAIVQAINGKNFLTLTMRDHTESSGEPHISGTRGGAPMVLLFNEENDRQWELVEAADIESVKTWLDEHFQKREIPAEFDPDRSTH